MPGAGESADGGSLEDGLTLLEDGSDGAHV
jgi:hypothetical protein